MKFYRQRHYFVYILTNRNKTVLYTGMTNHLGRRIMEHTNGKADSFTKRYNVHYLLYWEHFNAVTDAIAREKQIKSWSRNKKEMLIRTTNPEWDFLNHLV